MMNSYLEIRQENDEFPYSCYLHSGDISLLPHWHKEIEIVYVKKGTLTIGVNENLLTMEEGQIRIINGGEVHYFLSSPESERIVILFDQVFFKDMRLVQKEERSFIDIISGMEKNSLCWPEGITEKIKELIETIYKEEITKDKGYLYAIKAKMYELIVTLYRNVFNESNITEETKYANPKQLIDNLNRVFSYVEEHYQRKITIDHIAHYLGFNPQYFTRYFKKLTGQTFIHFLNEYRLNKAKWILLNEDIPIIEVANKAGFNSVKTFHHLFKEKFGISPLKYKVNIRE
ncbi:AraC family transcriptional regulator [Bacillus kwashiorkori]|uniref:AraC family transcriptional regulator n=1 Tax=Bacillus kwashiorkori TaxID=1522318 RepID=UPI000AFDA885|nr:AraC family transcriptional regulator [Bacillus kwashiorkori]